MYGYIYETINLINGKKYIGKHKSNTFDLKYLGSGIRLKNSIKKYGKENFRVTLLIECENSVDLNIKEIEIINELNACQSDNYYNISSGGDGGDITKGYTEKELEEFKRKSSVWVKLDRNSPEGLKLRGKYSNPGKSNPMYGKKRKDFSEVVIKNNSKKIKCDYCDVIGNLGNMKRWHFDNCKNKV